MTRTVLGVNAKSLNCINVPPVRNCKASKNKQMLQEKTHGRWFMPKIDRECSELLALRCIISLTQHTKSCALQ